MHESVMQWAAERIATIRETPTYILEVGSCNVNGSVRPLFETQWPLANYIGLDIVAGPGVDRVCAVEDASVHDLGTYDIVVSCEMLEHAEYWCNSFKAMAAFLEEDGHLLLTCRGPGFPRHNPPDYWRFTMLDLIGACRAAGFSLVQIEEDPQVPGVFLHARKISMPIVMPEPGWLGKK